MFPRRESASGPDRCFHPSTSTVLDFLPRFVLIAKSKVAEYMTQVFSCMGAFVVVSA
jgi:hypothetical protein